MGSVWASRVRALNATPRLWKAVPEVPPVLDPLAAFLGEPASLRAWGVAPKRGREVTGERFGERPFQVAGSRAASLSIRPESCACSS
ncbi:hypothetical protein GCM10027596_24550 [Nocardioides korecus]